MRSFAIIPAAGRSSRMGNSKLLLPWGRTTIIEQVLEAWHVGGVDERIVVVRPDDELLISACTRAGATLCVPREPPPEMKDSVAAGLALIAEQFAPTARDAWLVAPADLPDLSPRLIQLLIETYRGEAHQILIPRLADGRTGHPVLYSWDLAAEVASLPGTLRDLQSLHPAKFVEWTDAISFADIDTPHDYQNRHNRNSAPAE
jgi:molybdenum cofactor cytidylyltransferase